MVEIFIFNWAHWSATGPNICLHIPTTAQWLEAAVLMFAQFFSAYKFPTKQAILQSSVVKCLVNACPTDDFINFRTVRVRAPCNFSDTPEILPFIRLVFKYWNRTLTNRCGIWLYIRNYQNIHYLLEEELNISFSFSFSFFVIRNENLYTKFPF